MSVAAGRGHCQREVIAQRVCDEDGNGTGEGEGEEKRTVRGEAGEVAREGSDSDVLPGCADDALGGRVGQLGDILEHTGIEINPGLLLAVAMAQLQRRQRSNELAHAAHPKYGLAVDVSLTSSTTPSFTSSTIRRPGVSFWRAIVRKKRRILVDGLHGDGDSTIVVVRGEGRVEERREVRDGGGEMRG